MEELTWKIDSRNPVQTAQTFSRIAETIIEKRTDLKAVEKKIKLLKDYCIGPDTCITDCARAAVLRLVEMGVLSLEDTMADVNVCIPKGCNYPSVIKMISGLFYLKLSRNNASELNLEVQHHPFAQILTRYKHSLNEQLLMYSEIRDSCYKELSLSSHVHSLYYPVYISCICNPELDPRTSLLGQKLWTFLIEFDLENESSWTFKLCCWIRLTHASGTFLLCDVFRKQRNCDKLMKNVDYLVLMQILAMCVNRNYSAIETLLEFLPKITFSHNNLALLLLASIVLNCSPSHLEKILELCLYLIKQPGCMPYSYLALKCSLLHWLANPCVQVENALKIIEEILKLFDHVCCERPKIQASRLSIQNFHYLLFCNSQLFTFMQLANKLDCEGTDELMTLIEKFEQAPISFQASCFSFLCGILLDEKLAVDGKLRVLRLVIGVVEEHPHYAPMMFTMILYLLSNEVDSRLHFHLLKTLPRMTLFPGNLPKVITTLKALMSIEASVLTNFALRLMFDTWLIEKKCYSVLESLALKPLLCKQNVKTENEWSRRDEINRAYIFMNLARAQPQLHGKNLVPYFSGILNNCDETSDTLPLVLSFEAIEYLCEAGVVDMATTWNTLAPKFMNDTRPAVVKSFCRLLSRIPGQVAHDEKLYDAVTKQLWEYIQSSDEEDIVEAALAALSNYNIQLICSHMPEAYQDEKPQQGSDNWMLLRLPGKVWLNFLASSKSRKGATNFIIDLAVSEVKEYGKYIYEIKSRKEPFSYSGLPTYSIIRALMSHIKQHLSKVNQWEKEHEKHLFMDCLEIISAKFPRPLPPLNWSFLDELIRFPEFKSYCIDLASHQVVSSGSARKLMENLILSMTETKDTTEHLHIFRNLKYLANSIQPVILKPFLQNSLELVYPKKHDSAVDTFKKCLDFLIEVLLDDNIQNVNKHVIEDVLTELVLLTDVSTKAFQLLLNSVTAFTPESQSRLSHIPSIQMDKKDFIKTVKIRCHICAHSKIKPLNWINDIFAAVYTNNISLSECLEDITALFKKQLKHIDTPEWLRELLGEIQAKVAHRHENAEIEFYCDILALAVTHFSGLFVILPKNGHEDVKYYFPASLAFLLDQPEWCTYTIQILDWLVHMNKSDNIPDEYRHIFGWSLCSLRHKDELWNNSKWMKVMDCNIYTNTIS